jgi:beta-xylosidase
MPSKALGILRLFCIPWPDGAKNLWDVPNLLLQKFPAPEFTAVAKVSFHAMADGEKTGLVVMGMSYAYVAVEKKGSGLSVSQVVCANADRGAAEHPNAAVPSASGDVYLRVRVSSGARCEFAYSRDGVAFTPIGDAFQAVKGRWIGAKVGLFASRSGASGEFGYADYDWFRVMPNR